MHGDGTKLADIQNNPPPARLLDVTRLIRRAGRVLTGVDRVEMAYLESFLLEPVPVFGLVRTSFGYALLDQAGLTRIKLQLCGQKRFGKLDVLSRFPRGLTLTQRRALSDVRRLSIGRSIPRRLPKLLMEHLPQNTSYVNVGHSNLTDRVFLGVKAALGSKIAVMIHDVIPLDFPQFQRPGTVEIFRKKLQRVQKHTDFVIYNSADSQRHSEGHMAEWGELPKGIVSHLGTELPGPDPDFVLPKCPYFVAVGTIEPRKNHAFLLDIWKGLGPEAPELHICGARGWRNEAVFDRLDSLPEGSKVFERAGLNDSALAALVQGSQGLLFPSFAEGFGLPPVEAAALRVPILCNDLEVLREILGDIPVYVKVSDSYLWNKTVKELAIADPKTRKQGQYTPTSWSDHFKIVLSLI
jgi:glycosyltransferase involved in cell wall biosynthesis|tara:strand:- start:12018 stop:13247 length:1230 start_codon:yes stop_codon:yes gene_type:complete